MSILSTLLTPAFDNGGGDGGGESPLVAVLAQLSCPICQDVPTQPFLLPHCGHTFCYSCIKHWFKCNPSCPICRSIIGDSKPVLNHTVKAIIDQLISYINIQKLATPTFQTWRREKDEEFEEDRANDFPWLKKIKEHWGRAVVDAEDGVPRCSACHWELIDGQCENCGRHVMGWQDRTDGDELDGEEEDDDEDEDEDEEEDENLIDPSGYRRDNARMNYGSDIEDDDWDDYDNGMSDLRGRIVDDEADDDDENDDDEAGDMHEISSRNRHAFQYDSDDGFVVEDDDEDEQEDGNLHKDDEGGTSDIEIVDESGFASGDDDIVAMGRANSDVLNISDNSDDSDAPSIVKKGRTITFSDDDDDDDDDVDVDDIEDDEELISTSKFRKKAVIDENSDEEPVQEDELPSKKEKHSHKHKHRHHKHRSHKKNRR